MFLSHLVVFIATLIFDWASYIKPAADLNVTSWNPLSAIALVAFSQSRYYAITYCLALIIANWMIRDGGLVVADTILPAALSTTTYLVAAILWNYSSTNFYRLDNFRSLARSLAVFVLGALTNAGLITYFFWQQGKFDDSYVPSVLANLMIGDLVGILVFVPFFLVVLNPANRGMYRKIIRQPNFWIPILTIMLLVALLASFSIRNPLRYSYFLLLPLAFIAIRHGFAGISLATFVAQFCLIGAYLFRNSTSDVVLEVQTLMSVIAFVSLTIGVAVEEKARSDKKMRDNERAASLGQIAGVVTHEIGQPLTSIWTYAIAARNAMNSQTEPGSDDLRKSIDGIINESARAKEIVTKIKKLYSSSDMSRIPTDMVELMPKIIQSQLSHAKVLGVSLKFTSPDKQLIVHCDPSQLSLAIRNIVSNAMNAASTSPAKALYIRLYKKHSNCIVDFYDSGLYIDSDILDSIFDLGFSQTTGGMGVGLNLAMQIIEAHSGAITAFAESPLKFRVVLPLK